MQLVKNFSIRDLGETKLETNTEKNFSVLASLCVCT